MIQRHVWISGRVQGVGFRASTISAARHFPELLGFVRNLPDGRVEAVFSGQESDVLKMVAWCKNGSPLSKVTLIEVKEEPLDSSLGRFQMVRFDKS